jgi:hypothetical protein
MNGSDFFVQHIVNRLQRTSRPHPQPGLLTDSPCFARVSPQAMPAFQPCIALLRIG